MSTDADVLITKEEEEEAEPWNPEGDARMKDPKKRKLIDIADEDGASVSKCKKQRNETGVNWLARDLGDYSEDTFVHSTTLCYYKILDKEWWMFECAPGKVSCSAARNARDLSSFELSSEEEEEEEGSDADRIMLKFGENGCELSPSELALANEIDGKDDPYKIQDINEMWMVCKTVETLNESDLGPNVDKRAMEKYIEERWPVHKNRLTRGVLGRLDELVSCLVEIGYLKETQIYVRKLEYYFK